MDMNKTIYLDNSATTPICKEALDKYCEVSTESYGNPSSLHNMGLEATKRLDTARDAIRYSLDADDYEVIFTASGSEANNLALFGRALAKERYKKGKKIITTRGEHSSVSEPMQRLADMGYTVITLSTKGGKVDLDELACALDDSVILVSIMMVNNETGAIYDIPSISKLVKERSSEALLHVDATQGYLKIPFSISALKIDLLTISSHKIEGPKGVGALLVAKGVIKEKGLYPIVFGGGQELGLRSGTENVPAIAAFGEAARVGFLGMILRSEKIESLRRLLVRRIKETPSLSELSVVEVPFPAPHIVNITLPSIKSETMLHFLSSKGIYVSSGSACSSNTGHHSEALIAFGKSEKDADSSIRVSISHRNEREDIEALCVALAEGLEKLSRIRS